VKEDQGDEGMRGDDNQKEGIFSYISPEKRVPADHPLRRIRKMLDEILKEMSPQFQKFYSDVGRLSIAPGNRLTERRKRKCALTSTGLLMEGLDSSWPSMMLLSCPLGRPRNSQ
jgi:hypothetical protein